MVRQGKVVVVVGGRAFKVRRVAGGGVGCREGGQQGAGLHCQSCLLMWRLVPTGISHLACRQTPQTMRYPHTTLLTRCTSADPAAPWAPTSCPLSPPPTPPTHPSCPPPSPSSRASPCPSPVRRSWAGWRWTCWSGPHNRSQCPALPAPPGGGEEGQRGGGTARGRRRGGGGAVRAVPVCAATGHQPHDVRIIIKRPPAGGWEPSRRLPLQLSGLLVKVQDACGS